MLKNAERFLAVTLGVLVVIVGLLLVTSASAQNNGSRLPFVRLQSQIPSDCAEDAVLVPADGAVFENGQWSAYDCGPSLDDFCPWDPEWVPTTEVTPTEPPETPTEPPVTETPTPEPTDEPEERCNRGIGNLEEGCDPGNSYGQGQGGGRPAGEDRHEADGPPGNQNHENRGNGGGNPNN